ncbi:MAG: tetratricopeptide repeat protein [Phycisphaerae bacterium]|nr:tetratricopeptide repeat protein [Phycisphaerae bacterium]
MTDEPDMDERDSDLPNDRDRAPRAGERHAQRAAEHFRRGRLAEAEAELRKAIAGDPDRGDWHFNLGMTLDAAGRLDEAVVAFREAAERLPRRAEARLAEATVLCRLERFSDALPALTAACSLDPTCEPAWARRIEALAALNRRDDAETAYYLAQQRLEKMPFCLVAMGDAQMTWDNHERAAWCYREALNVEPQLPRVRAKLARALAAIGNSDAAARMYIEELRHHPGDVQTLLECGDLLASLHRPGEAVEKYRRAVELAPTLAAPRVRLGMLLGALGRLDQARAELETAYAFDPDVALLRTTLAGTLVAEDELVAALKLLREDASRRSDFASESAAIELVRVAELLVRCDAANDATDLLLRVLTDRPRDPAVLRKLMVVAFAAGRPRVARGIARRLLRVDPTADLAVGHNLILDAIESRRLSIASARLRAALERHPGDAGLRALRVTWWFAFLRNRLRLRSRVSLNRPAL